MLILPDRFAHAMFWLLCVAASTSFADAEPCRHETFEEAGYVVCSFDLAKDDLRMAWKDGEGAPYKTFDALAESLKGQGLTLSFAMNAGMYDDDFSPVGLYVEEGKELHAANTKTVTGEPQEIPNFFKKPNGVFYLTGKAAGVMTTDAWLAGPPKAKYATQSGPMLVIDGKIHPAFIENSTDRKRRDGVGVASPKTVHFAISEDPVNFFAFARFFRERLGCQNALFLDGGSAPGLYAPELQRSDAPGHGGYGPIIAVVTKQ
jgi:uncharacterized protein YigE (DUF2233 family)